MAFPASIMSCSRATVKVLFVLIISMVIDRISGDPEALQDFCVADTKSPVFMNGRACLNPNEVSPKHFMTSDLRKPANISGNPLGVSTVAASSLNMPGLNTLGMMMVRLDMAVGGIYPPHIHSRATEIVYIVEGTVSFGFVESSTNRLFSQTLEAGDVFVVPKGTLHYAQNVGKKNAFILVAFNSQNPGFLNVPSASFASSPGIPQEVLAKSFSITLQEVEHIRKNI